ncbi:FecR family protein [Pleomorphovibrio marinus]|uniref:FecR family protein n=1 Tax=Pleomorphovibrio marinus TaxID=2164132 RepID=UPI000E0AA1A1|nr:FecR family protein [Pleomorphovibrio marinus]
MKTSVNHIFIQLITDPEFIIWVNFRSKERTLFWEKWAKDQPDRQEALLHAVEFLSRLHFREVSLSEKESDKLLEGILKEKVEKKGTTFSRKREWFFSQWIRVASILVCCLLGGYTLDRFTTDAPIVNEEPTKPIYHTIKNPKGRRSLLKLPDGTRVHLSHDSELVFPQTFAGKRREVFLKGEAYFEVAPKDSTPFLVKVKGMAVNVIGTSFNVKSRDKDYESVVSLVTGKVKIALDEQIPEKELSPGEQFSLNLIKNEIALSHFHVEKVTGWKDGVIHFHDADMDDFIEVMEDWYGVNFQVFGRSSPAWKINAKYKDETLEEILMGLQYVYGISFKINGKTVWMKVDEQEISP